MAHLIDKDALVAEIKRRKQVAYGWMETAPNDAIEAEFELCDDILSFLETLEVKEVDDEPECKIFPKPIECYSNCKECPWLATNNKAQKREEV